jgi:hypothetical protein
MKLGVGKDLKNLVKKNLIYETNKLEDKKPYFRVFTKLTKILDLIFKRFIIKPNS